MSSCAECKRAIGKQADKVQCCACEHWYHTKCVQWVAGQERMCDKCRDKSEVQTAGSSPPADVLTQLRVLTEEIRSMKVQQVELGKSLELCHTKLDDNARSMKEQQEELKKCVTQIEALTQENVNLKSQVRVLQERAIESEQYSRRNTLEIQGIPDRPNENVLDTVRMVGKALDVNISNEMVEDACHRLPKQPSQKSSTLIVKFVRRFDKERLMERRRVKRNLSTRHLGLGGDDTIYINESLVPEKRRLLAQARLKRKEKNYEFLWVRNGVIKIRKSQGSPIITINCADDISKL